MSLDLAIKHYRHEPGKKLDLKKHDPKDRKIFKKKDLGAAQALEHLSQEIKFLQRKLYASADRGLLVVIQAMDTGGKDGCVRDVFAHVDPQGLQANSFKKPSEDELEHDFLWRIHQQVPRKGQIVIFNRSHYEDIIAVRVKELFPKSVWEKRYRHITDFEQMLVDEGTVIVKIFLNISKSEQKKRLQARLDNPDKHWKFNPDDLKDRARWSEFMKVYRHVIEKTSTKDAPWYIIPADDKWYRNLCVASIILETLRDLDLKFPKTTWDPKAVKIV